jgi:serine/threonine-protein kinase
LPLPVAIAIAYFVAQALHYAHTKDYTLYGHLYRGLIHRDIKPDNILVTRDGMVKLMDFGIARPTDVSLHTVGDNIMGTLTYLSPEQLHGKNLDHRTDIFSLGCVLYEMITGHMAFPQKSLTELVRKKSAGEIQSIESFGLAVPESTQSVVTACMALDPNNRFSSAADLAHELYGILGELSDRAPQDIICRFLRGDELAGFVHSPAHHSLLSRIPYRLIIAAGAAIAVFLLGAVTGAILF